jgi:endonuclease-8
MPEGDAVFLTANRLHTALAGGTVTRFELRVPHYALADLRGTSVIEIKPYGKHILMRFDDGHTLHSHLRMDGSWRVGPPNRRPSGGPEHAIRAVVGTSAALASGVRVHDLALIATSDEHELIGHLGPDLLSPDLDVPAACRRLAQASDTPLAIALLDQRLVAGLGTIWRSEVLWSQGLSPFATVSTVADLEPLVRDSARLLNRSVATQRGVRSRDPFLANEARLQVYGRSGRPCRRCGASIESAHLGPDAATERIVYYCPRCQAA